MAAVVGASVQVSVAFQESFVASIMLRPFILDHVGRLVAVYVCILGALHGKQ